MNVSKLQPSMIKQENVASNTPMIVKENQILLGKVNKLLANQMAEIQIGQHKMLTHVSTSITAQEKYWFEVKSKGDQLQLKLLPRMDHLDDKSSTASLLQHFSLPETKKTSLLIQAIQKENLPITEEIVKNATRWIANTNDIKRQIGIMKEMLLRNLPFTENVFKSLQEVYDGMPVSELLARLEKELVANDLDNPRLTKVLATFSEDDLLNMNTVGEFKEAINKILKSLGFSYELDLLQEQNEVLQQPSANQIKPLLLDLLKGDVPSTIKETATMLIDKITGFQLLSQDIGPNSQLIMQLPLILGNYRIDTTIQYNGRKTKNGQLDPDYCKILFYLDLQNLKETVVDLQIQNRIMNITVLNNKKKLNELVEVFVPSLKEKMKQASYTLLEVQSKPLLLTEENKVNHLEWSQSSTLNGVDIKI